MNFSVKTFISLNTLIYIWVIISLEIRFHGRGGQGVVTSAELLATAAGIDGSWASAFPIYGAERRGAEIEAYCRISKSQIRETSPISRPDVVVILDPTLLKISNPLRGLKESGKIIINSKVPPSVDFETYYIDATKIAIDNNLVKSGWPLVNIIMLGALLKVIGAVSLESLKIAIEEEFEGKIAELNEKAVEIAYNSVKEVEKIAV